MAKSVDPRGPASWPQAMLIKRLTRGARDIRSERLTYQQASDLINQLKQAAGATPSQPLDHDRANRVSYTVMLKEAIQAANKAGDEWMSKAKPQFHVVQLANPFDDTSPVVKDYGPMLDVCGIVYTEITDKRTAFAKWVKKRQNGYNNALHVRHKYDRRQEMGLLEACERAAIGVFANYGIKGLRLYSRID